MGPSGRNRPAALVFIKSTDAQTRVTGTRGRGWSRAGGPRQGQRAPCPTWGFLPAVVGLVRGVSKPSVGEVPSGRPNRTVSQGCFKVGTDRRHMVGQPAVGGVEPLSDMKCMNCELCPCTFARRREVSRRVASGSFDVPTSGLWPQAGLESPYGGGAEAGVWDRIGFRWYAMRAVTRSRSGLEWALT